jgi:quinoprotein dehydrogenase-associated probable ABC transporter substrate-binding protein
MLAVIAAFLAAGACAAAPALRVCADPHNLPYSDKQQQGFENQIAKLIGADLGMHVSYFWYPQVEKFFAKTLNSGNCDVVMGVPSGFQDADVTRPYYHSSYVFVSRSADHLSIRSFDDPRMRKLRIGVHVFGESEDSVPPVYSLASRGIVRNVISYSILSNGLSGGQPLQGLIRALGHNQIDIAIAWGPIAGYFARKSNIPLTIAPIEGDPRNPSLPFTFAVGIGVRKGDTQLKKRLDVELTRRSAAISRVLERYGIPQVNMPNEAGDFRRGELTCAF